MTKLLYVLIFTLTFTSLATAAPLLIQPTDTLVFTFVTHPENWDDPPDYLDFYFYEAIHNTEDTGASFSSVAFYDGATLLGSRTGAGFGATFQGAGMEIHPSNVGRYRNFVDFSSIVNGTIDGRLEMQGIRPFLFDPDRLDLRHWSPDIRGPHPVMLFDVRPNEGFWIARGDFDWLTVTDVTVRSTAVPEPATGLLLAVGCLVAYRARKRM